MSDYGQYSTDLTMSSFKAMPRADKAPAEKFPKHQVPNASVFGKTGITFSVEDKHSSADSKAELEVLKAILNREGYLNRLKQVARTVGKKFKPEIADVLDLVRASTLDVIDMVLRWREVKKDHDAAFIWNGVNYILKMSSDLDYLADYLAIKRWIGFPLVRNPFAIPYPMEEGQEIYTKAALDPQHLDKGNITDGFILGGMTKHGMHKHYVPHAKQQPQQLESLSSPHGSFSAQSSSQQQAATTAVTKSSPYGSSPSKPTKSLLRKPTSMSANTGVAAQSFVFNENMSKIRQAEAVVLAEERKFGILAKDPQGRLMPRLQALTRQAAHELKKDDRKPLTEPAETLTYAPHAESSDIGVAPANWTPGAEAAPPSTGAAAVAATATLNDTKGTATKNENTAVAKGAGAESMLASASMGDFASAAALQGEEIPGMGVGIRKQRSVPEGGFNNLYSAEIDPSLLPTKRGEGKSGGLLAPLTKRGADSRLRRPLKTTLTAEMEFKRTRQIRTLGEKLDEIAQLREKINAEKRKLEEEAARSRPSSLRPRQHQQQQQQQQQQFASPTGNSYEDGVEHHADHTQKMSVVKSAVSNRTFGSSVKNVPAYMKHLQEAEAAEAAGGAAGGTSSSPALSRENSIKRTGSREGSRDGEIKRSGSRESIKRTTEVSNSSGAGGGRVKKSSSREKLSQTSPARMKRSGSREKQKQQQSPAGNRIRAVSQDSDSELDDSNHGRSRRASFAQALEVEQPLAMSEEMLALEAFNAAKQDEVQYLQEEQIISSQQRDHHLQVENKISAIKENERHQKNRELSRDIERKRRKLTAEEGVRVGPPPDDPPNMYDYYSIKLQSVIRGFVARRWIKWFRAMSRKAAIKLQSAMRGWFGRMRVRKIRKEFKAAQLIQKNFRGWSTRGTSAAMAKKKNFGRSAVLIQRIWRGILGQRRAQSKRALDKAAKLAFECVDERVLIVDDVKELARRILYAIEEPSTTSFPPDEVLHLIRLCVMVIQSARGNLGIADYDFFNSRNYEEEGGEDLTWLQAAKMVNRAERFMRLVRLMAYGPGAKPPRLVQLPNAANLLYAAQSQNPRWNFRHFENMGMGSKICVQLFKWLSSIVEVAARQQEFLTLIASSFPDWLPKLHDLQKSQRLAEMEIELNTKCLQILGVFKDQAGGDEVLEGVLETEMNLVKRAKNDANGRMRETIKEVDRLKMDQSSREVYALEAMEVKVQDNTHELEELIMQYHAAFSGAQKGDRASIEALPELRHNLTNQRLKVTELDGQRKILENQVEGNRQKRKDPARLPPEIIVRSQIAGEEKAAYITALVKTRTMLQVAEVKDPDNLPMHLVGVYQELESEENRLKAVARKAFVAADDDRKQYDEIMGQAIAANEVKEQKAKDRMQPSDEELQEERMEDEKFAIAERLKHRQYVPDAVLHVAPTRPRPVVICLSRDLSFYSKRKLHEEITKLMPGLFVSLSNTENMGVDIHTMQQVLDSSKCVIMDVDPGLTRLTRDTFLQTLEITTDALIPKPFVAIAVGDEMNKRTSGAASSYHGVDKDDLLLYLKDGSIKTSMEGKSWVISELQRADIRKIIYERSAELVPPSSSFVIVVEALFVALSENDVYKSPDMKLSAMSWRVTRNLLIEPRHIVEKMQQMRRGVASLKLVECLQCYLNHNLWPPLYGPERSADPVLHLFAYYVEQYVSCEQGCRRGGGVPLQALTKSSMRGIQTVVTVRDRAEVPEEADLLLSGGWKMAAYRLVRTAMQDMRVLKTVLKIEDILYTVSVYRDCGNLYFEAYDADSSDIYMAVVAVADVPSLLIPNAFTATANVEHIVPPQTPQEMYMWLCRLLRFELGGYRKREKVLTCRRQYTFLGNLTRKLNGHIVLLKYYEAALGELYFTAYMPEFSAHLTFLIDAPMRLMMQENADTGDSGESEHVNKEDARPLLPFMLDRLRVSPSKSIVLSKGIDLNDGFRKNQGLVSTIKRQGFTLSARLHGGVGRIMARRICRFYDVLHILEVRISQPTQLMDITVYEPKMQHTMRLRISRFLRRVLLGPISDDLRLWFKELRRRVKIDWRGEHSIKLDHAVFSAVRRVKGVRVIVRFLAVDEETLGVEILNPHISMTFEASLTKEDIIRLILYESVADKLERKTGQIVQNLVVREILKDMRMTLDVPTTEVTIQTHPDLYEKPLEYFMTDRAKLSRLADQLAAVLSPADKNKPQWGFVSRSYPVQVVLKPMSPNSTQDDRPAIDTSLRFDQRAGKNPSRGTMEDLLRTRAQPPRLVMEEALNDMAYKASQASRRLSLAQIKAALEVQQHLESLPDDSTQNEAVEDAALQTTKELLNNIHDQVITRFKERNEPGSTQAQFEQQQAESAAERARQEEEAKANAKPYDEDDSAIVMDEKWKKVFEAGVKTHFREVKVRWQGHVSVKISEAPCWTENDGMGKRYKFEVYEPKVAQTFEGIIRSRKHLREILGLHGQDLVEPSRVREMLMFVCKYRLDVVVNKVSWDGVAVEEGAPPYRIEFQSDRMFTATDKVTPINAAEEEDEEVNRTKLMDIDNARGKKIARLVRRVSGLLMQLTIFELPGTVAEAAYAATKAQLLAAANPASSDGIAAAAAGGEGEEGGDEGRSQHSEGSRKTTGSELVPHSQQAVGGALQTVGGGEKEEDGEEEEDDDANMRSKWDEEEEAEEEEDPNAGVDEEVERLRAEAKQPGDASNRKDYVENRINTTVLERYPPPAFRVVGYDPRSKRKVTLGVEPQAIIEVAGGVYSPYLDPERRRELAKIIADALVLIFPANAPFELLVPWSGAKKEVSTATVEKEAKLTMRSGAEKVLKRPGRIFRSALRISNYELLVSLYAHTISQVADTADNTDNRQLIFNFYSPAVSEATEVAVSETEQIERIGRPVQHFGEGAQRAVAIRRLCRFFRAEVIEDILDDSKKTLHVVLLPPNKGFVTDYQSVSAPGPGEDVRPVGIPGVFFPLNTCGRPLHRRGMSLENRARTQPDKEYLVTVYTKSMTENAERGLVVKLYDRVISETAVLHIGASELQRICLNVDEPDLLRDLVYAQQEEDGMQLDDVEKGFTELTDKGELQRKTQGLINRLMDVVLDDLGFYISPQESIVPYIKSGPRGVFPA